MAEPVVLSLPFSTAELTQLREAGGRTGVEDWGRAVLLDLAADLADAEPPEAEARPIESTAPLLAVGGEALLLEELRALRDEIRHALAEQLLWLQVLYAELQAQAAYPSQADEAAACARAGERLARMKRLVAEKLAS